MSTDVITNEKVRIKVSEPKKWKVILINDDQTSVDFVISLLIEVFKHTMDSATIVTLQVHESGSGVAGLYDFEIAEIKAVEATKLARESGFPLQIKITED